jgi:hypothetical protein
MLRGTIVLLSAGHIRYPGQTDIGSTTEAVVGFDNAYLEGLNSNRGSVADGRRILPIGEGSVIPVSHED